MTFAIAVSSLPRILWWALLRVPALLLVAATGLTLPASAQTTHITPALRAESATPAPGSRVTIAIAMKAENGWHGYWINPGEAGLPARFRWTLPSGVAIGDAQWPVPTLATVGGITSNLYPGSYAILYTLTLPAGLTTGTALPVAFEGEWLSCTDAICVPERGGASITLSVGGGARDAQAQFDAHRAALPAPLGEAVHIQRQGDRIRLAIPWPANAPMAAPHVFSPHPHVLNEAAPQSFSRSGSWLIAELTGDAAARPFPDGLLTLGLPGERGTERHGFSFSIIEGAVPAAGAPVAALSAGNAGAGEADGQSEGTPIDLWSIASAIGAAALGGLLLNVMPCVFPILSMKALSLARLNAHETRTARREAIGYMAGTTGFCLLLGAMVLGLRAGGQAVGWAFQLQEPRVVLILFALTVGLTLNLADVFQFPAIGSGGWRRSGKSVAGKSAVGETAAGRGFVDGLGGGVLAALVATPCTGPFMGAALGAALVLPLPAALGVFAGLGLGLGLPFLAFAYVPAFRRMLPRPGRWMARLRHLLAIPMGLTALACGWLLWRQTGWSGLSIAMALALGLGLWLAVVGWSQKRGPGGPMHGRLSGAGIVSLVTALIVVPALIVLPYLAAPPARTAPEGNRFSAGRLAALRAEGKPVFVNFTADWCVTCKVNERAAIDRAEVRAAFQRAGVVSLTGDWTLRDAEITRFLGDMGRSGVPLYLYYAPGAAQPEVLPQMLTPAMLVGLTSAR